MDESRRGGGREPSATESVEAAGRPGRGSSRLVRGGGRGPTAAATRIFRGGRTGAIVSRRPRIGTPQNADRRRAPNRPLVTIVFFAAACLQSDEGLGALPGKIKNDLVAVQLAGVSFWPIVDIVSFSLIPVAYIPLFVNFASFIWTIFLSLKSRTAKK